MALGDKTPRIGEVLIRQKVITQDQLLRALEIQKTNKRLLGEILIQEGFITEESLCQAFAAEYSLPFVDLNKETVDEKTTRLIPFNVLRKCRLLPLRVENGRLVLATSDPLDILSLQEIGRLTGLPEKLVIATPKQIDSFISRFSSPIQHATEAIKEASQKEDPGAAAIEIASKDPVELAIHEAPVVKLVNSILEDGISQGASDIHMEPQAEGLFVRFRIDGILYERMKVPPDLQAVVLSRMKIISGMDIAERRQPQDGRINYTTMDGKKSYDLRASTLPGVFGEKIVLRILDKSSILIPLEHVVTDEHELAILRKLIQRPHGIVLITGPTGSGKTTTLYSMLNLLNDSSRNIITVEDPVEYELSRIHQTSVNPKAGYTFARAIRHILRQDPDIIMVGEIRDLETAEIAIQAAITGHLVLSTLHTNTAPGAITRLMDMNVEPFLISSSVVGVVAQRLVRRLCPFCRQEYVITDELRRSLGTLIPSDVKEATMAKPVGCDKCRNLGYSKRLAIFEIFVFNDQLRELALKRVDESVLARTAISMGMKTLKASGIKKALEKVTSLEEVMRTCFLEQD